MKVLYDYQAFSIQTHGGVSRSFSELIKHLPKGIETNICIKETDNVYLSGLPNITPKGKKYNDFCFGMTFPGKGHLHSWSDIFRKIKYYPDYNKNYCIHQLQQGNFDIFHPTFFDDYFLPYLKGKPFVLTIHDMIPELYPQYFGKNDFQIINKKKLAPLADAIIAVSHNTKKDIMSFLDIPEEKIHVVYHGCSFPKQCKKKRLFNESYLLYVGDRFGYKNFNLFVKHISPFLKKHPEIKVICTGKAFLPEELELMKTYSCKENFINYWVATDEEFYSIYHNALCFIFTSDYEGFGIPILEAYKADCPVFLNNKSCFPEIADDAAIFFDLSSDSSNLSKVLEDFLLWTDDRKQQLLMKQRERLKLFSWTLSAQKLSEVYKSVANIRN